MTPAELRALYDATLREGEMASADRVERVGPVLMGWYGGERGFVTYRDLGGLDAAAIRDLVTEVVQRYRADQLVEQIEWKSRGHDDAPGLDEALRAHGLLPQEPESVMIGPANRPDRRTAPAQRGAHQAGHRRGRGAGGRALRRRGLRLPAARGGPDRG